MSSRPYYTMIRSKDHKFDLRLRLVIHARQHGVRPAARAFGCSRNTVRKWLRRFELNGRRALQELSRAPHRRPQKTSKRVETMVLNARQRSGFGGDRLVREFDLPCSAGAASQIKATWCRDKNLWLPSLRPKCHVDTGVGPPLLSPPLEYGSGRTICQACDESAYANGSTEPGPK